MSRPSHSCPFIHQSLVYTPSFLRALLYLLVLGCRYLSYIYYTLYISVHTSYVHDLWNLRIMQSLLLCKSSLAAVYLTSDSMIHISSRPHIPSKGRAYYLWGILSLHPLKSSPLKHLDFGYIDTIRKVAHLSSLMSLLPPDPAVGGIEELGSDVCLPEHCLHAFDALYCALVLATPIAPTFSDDKYPLFVTWNTRSSRPGRAPRLRGCIGSFEPLPLHEGLAEYALISAFRDSRFRKIDKSELQSLECGVSLLTNFEDADSYLDWTIGVHGIYITFPHPSLLDTSSSETPSPLSSSGNLPRITSKQSFSATYLPDVIPDQGWSKIETIDNAINKAGWNGRITEDIRRSVKLRRYQSKKCVVTWEEYIQWRDEQPLIEM